ncbi:MAG: methyltransferase domain-containing protein [Nitrospirota bacterium]
MFHILKKFVLNYRRERFLNGLPLQGYTQHLNEIPFVDTLSDADLAELNHLLQWQCFTVDCHGRRFGNAAWEGKRGEPQSIPDRRIVLMHQFFNLSDKHLLEVGCFEGIHTIGLSQYARQVTAIDARIENVVKTIVRCAFFGCHPTIFQYNIEEQTTNFDRLSADLMHHVGVLYHLKDPVRHLKKIGQYIRLGLMIDTHYAEDTDADETYEVDGKSYRYKKYKESGVSDVFSGVYDHAKWLRLSDIIETLKISGFGKVEIIEERKERNGPRVLLMAQRG